MIHRMLLALLLLTSILIAEQVPATTQSASTHWPTPAELAGQLKAIADKQSRQSHVALIHIDGAVTEQPAGFSFFGGAPTTLQSLVSRIDTARKDETISALLIDLGAGAELNLSQAEEIRDALIRLRDAKKKAFVYADSFDTAGYVLASGASDICLLGGGEIMLPGVGFEAMFYRGAFDKLGVQADYVQIGEYKGAQEPYTRTGPTDELRGEFKHLSDAMYDELVAGLSHSRNVAPQVIQQLVERTIVTGEEALNLKLIDHVLDQDGLRDLLKHELHNDIDLIADYGEADRANVDLSNPFSLLSALTKKPAATTRPSVAVVYAHGVITDGGAQQEIFSESGVGSDSMRKALRIAARDDSIKAVVLRIDSPGGSALASEVMWQAARRITIEAHKPLIVSVGAMAASGGYYLASAGDTIFADPHAIVGSIGVVGGKLVLKDLFNKLGLSTEMFAHGANADLFSQETPWTDQQRELVHHWMQATYDQFTQRVMTTRTGKIKEIDAVARGRIFLAGQAKSLGMIDQIGGCADAIEFAAAQAKLEPDSYDIRSLPAPRTLVDYLNGGDDPQTRAPLSAAASPMLELLSALSPSSRTLFIEQCQMLQLLQHQPVLLACPVLIK